MAAWRWSIWWFGRCRQLQKTLKFSDKLSMAYFSASANKALCYALLLSSLWAVWSFTINSDHGTEQAIRSAITQSAFTFINTFLYTIYVEYINPKDFKRLKRFSVIYLLPNTVTSATLIVIHAITETPNIVETTSPIIVFLFLITFINLKINYPIANN